MSHDTRELRALSIRWHHSIRIPTMLAQDRKPEVPGEAYHIFRSAEDLHAEARKYGTVLRVYPNGIKRVEGREYTLRMARNDWKAFSV